jgi:arsenite methyltransferase
VSITEFLAAQLRKPSGIYGRLVMLPALNRHNSPINSLVFKQLRLSAEDRVLEIGFGGGALLKTIAAAVQGGHVAGVDYSSDAVGVCRRKLSALVSSGLLELHCADVCQLPFQPESFTRVCSVNTIYFWEDPLAAFREIHRVMQTDGVLVLGLSPRKELQSRPFTRYGFTLYEQDDVADMLLAAGFQDVSAESGGNTSGHWVAMTASKV